MRLQGSLVNRMMEVSKQPVPVVGMAATLTYWSDRHAATVTNVYANGREVEVQRDQAKMVEGSGMSEQQVYEFSPDPNGRVHHFTLRKNGQYVPRGQSMNSPSPGLLLGHREEYSDPTF